jgi:hypothetical protein
MNEMRINETLRFTVKVILPIVIAVLIVFLVFLYVIFPAISLTLEEFTLVYWSLSAAAFPLDYQALRWTEYVIKRYGTEKEKNPVTRSMFIRGDLRAYWVACLGTYLFLLICYIMAVYSQSLVFLITPLLVTAGILYDFLNDFYVIRKLKTDSTKLQTHTLALK